MDNKDIGDFFSDTQVSIWHNQSLREPQMEGYFAIREHFSVSEEHCYVQLPVGCGKTGLMGLSPFGIAKGRVLIIAPNLTIRENIRRELNVVNGGVKPHINGEQRVAEATTCRVERQGVESRQAAPRLLRCAPALRVTRRNPLTQLAFMAGSRLPAVNDPLCENTVIQKVNPHILCSPLFGAFGPPSTNVGDPNCFYSKRGIFVPRNGPYLSELKTGANIHDCDAAHIVVANIQQFAGARNRWYEALPTDYFDMILVDEGHHNVADTWTRLFAHFEKAKVISFTATPVRADGQVVSGTRVYRFGYARSMIMGFISQIDALFVKPAEIHVHGRRANQDARNIRDHENARKGLVQPRCRLVRGVQPQCGERLRATAPRCTHARFAETDHRGRVLNSARYASSCAVPGTPLCQHD